MTSQAQGTAGGPVLRAAIIGTGRIADLYDDETLDIRHLDRPQGCVHDNLYLVKPVSHAGAYRSLPGYRLVAAANRGRERLEDFGRRHGVSALYTDMYRMLAEEKPDVVSICTQSEQKHEAVLACAQAGVKAVIVEKAMATSLKEADEMIAACAASGTFLAVHHPMRFSLMWRRAKQLIDEGVIGTLSAVTSYCGSLVHGGTHDFDLMGYLAGPATWVSARIPRLQKHEEDGAGAVYDDLPGDVMIAFENGVTGFYKGSTPSALGMDVRGTKGYMLLPRGHGQMRLVLRRQRSAEEFGVTAPPGGRPVRPLTWEEDVEPWPERAAADAMSATQRMLTELYATLVHGAPFVSDGVAGRAALELGIAAYHSALNNAPVSLPLADRSLRVRNR